MLHASLMTEGRFSFLNVFLRPFVGRFVSDSKTSSSLPLSSSSGREVFRPFFTLTLLWKTVHQFIRRFAATIQRPTSDVVRWPEDFPGDASARCISASSPSSNAPGLLRWLVRRYEGGREIVLHTESHPPTPLSPSTCLSPWCATSSGPYCSCYLCFELKYNHQ